ncbi:hypothetical protein JX266_009104 [Neoarthrinium moseri]|uniref:uncharacterized protein n=1 Tax=Neoarthrinium moseri TaxID=1658444 RepID=UPI001FDD55AC|nr:uncharacterized protein JN550_008039 [Neoarthrinium moseri]KAI1844648.1 hypothetical protein JX266_009104 [Neoarthrinium moseri]KAI1866061.1 hypothetical protein JN550_008039 [Neoarthrinium moseri]
MGQSPSITAEIEIQASPDAVRSVFMDFGRYKEWSQWYFEPVEATKSPTELQEGDRMKIDLGAMKFEASIVKSPADSFSWDGNFYGLLAGKHEFMFNPSTKHAGGTTFLQKEEFRGVFAFLMAPQLGLSGSTLSNWNQFNADLKKKVESSSS